jgi:thiol-disulfide isomerase/thioredoxin
MKKLVSLFLISTFILSCTNEKKDITISGKITNPEQGYLLIYLPAGDNDTIRLNSDGGFSYTLPAGETPISSSLMFNKVYIRLYLTKGMDLKITLDSGDIPGTLKFEGAGSNINSFLAATAVKDKELNLNDYEIFKKDSATFYTWNNKAKESQSALLDNFKKENPSDIFWKTQRAEIDFGWANRLGIYPTYYRYYTDSTYKIREGFYAYQDKMDFNNGDFVNSGEFRSFLSNLISRKAVDVMKNYPSDSIKPSTQMLYMKTAINLLKNESVRDNYLTTYMKGIITYRDLSLLDQEIKFYRENCKDAKLLAGFEKEYGEMIRLQKGQPAIDFTGENASKQKVSLSDFRGKYVYVDVWATWCGPCKYEIPYLKKLEEDYHSKNIVFMSYSIDDDRGAWEKFVPENELKGVQIIGEKGWSSKLCKDYKIFGVPTFMLFDTEGKIITINMTRPSNDKTRITLDALKGI